MSGWVSQYADGLMTEVVSNRVAWGHLSANAWDYTPIAVLECERLGNTYTIVWEDGAAEPAMVVDCANPDHVETVDWMIDNAIVFEVGAQTARERGFFQRGGVHARLQR